MSIVQKGSGKLVKKYKGVTLMPTLYKVYVTILADRLREEMEGRGLLTESQMSFRKGRGTMDAVYVMNDLVNRQVSRKKRVLVALFVDVKAAFNSVGKKTVIEAMRGREVRKGLIVRVREVLLENNSRVRIGKELEERFWTAKGVRQGCPLSPILFIWCSWIWKRRWKECDREE